MPAFVMPSRRSRKDCMPKTCAQAVGGLRKNVGTGKNLSTQYTALPTNKWTKHLVIPQSIHNFCIQVCTPKLSQITDRISGFSPLSTALIMNTNQEKKENLLIGSGG
jgi:hypothetical protein